MFAIHQSNEISYQMIVNGYIVNIDVMSTNIFLAGKTFY